MKKRVLSLVLVVVLAVASLMTLTACNPYETVKKLAQKMVDTQKYTVKADFTMNILGMNGTVSVTAKVDGGKNYVALSTGEDSSAINLETYFYVNDAGKRQEMIKDAQGKWETQAASNSDDGMGQYGKFVTVDFDWEKFTEEYFDQDGTTLTLKKDKYTDFLPSTLASMVDYFKVSATMNSMSIEYSVTVMGQNIVVKMGISDIGTTTVVLPE